MRRFLNVMAMAASSLFHGVSFRSALSSLYTPHAASTAVRSRSRYMPHRGGGRRPISRPFLDIDMWKVMRARAKRTRRAFKLAHIV